jgi:hypothetical protein
VSLPALMAKEYYVVTVNEQPSVENHDCVNEDWICVFYEGFTYEEHFRCHLRVQGVLTLCPVCKKQNSFNGSALY